MQTLREETGWGNGNALDLDGSLLTCEHHGRRVSRLAGDGTVTTVADRYQGGKLNSPNDIVVKSDGTVWFTDPDYVYRNRAREFPAYEKDQDANYVFRFDPRTRELTPVAGDFDLPNGLCFSPDEKRFYVAEAGEAQLIRVFDVRPDNTVANGRVFAEIDPGFPDGIKTDRAGRLFVAAEDGIHIFDVDGSRCEALPLPARPSNLCFGGEDGATLFITTPQTVYSIQTLTGP